MTRPNPTFLLFLLTLGCSSGPPADLTSIEGDAEHAYDLALVEDYTGLQDTAASVSSAWTAFRPTAEADGAPSAVLTGMDQATTDLETAAQAAAGPAATGRAANAISSYMPQLYDLYSPAIPVEILAMDYQGREIVLDGMDVDFTAAVADVDTLASTWATVRPLVVSAGGDAEAADFDASVDQLTALATGEDAKALIDEANVNLELVDVLEGLF